ncbi:MAG: ATP-binding protein [Alphaproteobacteria bacterium]|nr:ATP-binding protein [Alphaproteobacteria bacterium]
MLVKYSVSNFGSFDSEQEISFEKTGSRQHLDHIVSDEYLSGAVIYGANASGKSNFMNSLSWLSLLIEMDDISSLNVKASQFRFSENNESVFKISFIWSNKKYLYEMKIRPAEFVSEKFELIKDDSQTELIFRRSKGKVECGGNWSRENKTVADRMSYIRKLDTDGLNSIDWSYRDHIENLYEFFGAILLFNDKTKVKMSSFYNVYNTQSSFPEFLNRLLQESDVGIQCAEFVKISDDLTNELLKSKPSKYTTPVKFGDALSYMDGEDYYVFTFDVASGKAKGEKLKIKVENEYFELSELSTGTNRLIHLALALYNFKNYQKGALLIIDEFDSSLHPFIVKRLLQQLLADNKNGSQILVSLHNTLLMDIQDIWRDDEIWFVKKDFDHSSKLYSLADFAPRKDKDVERGYLNGVYGAIPFLGAHLFLDGVKSAENTDEMPAK